MRRREFIARVLPATEHGFFSSTPMEKRSAAGLEPYVPSPSQPWDQYRALHLLKRTMFGAPKQQVDVALSKSPGEVVDILLENKSLPSPPAAWVSEAFERNPLDERPLLNRIKELREWWIKLMLDEGMSFRERMTLFLHNTFPIFATKTRFPQLIYSNVNLLRTVAFGNIRELVRQLSSEPGMLYCYEGYLNTKTNNNSTYAKILLENFTVGSGNYTAQDVTAAAQACTGWTFYPGTAQNTWKPQTYRDMSRYDGSVKTFMGKTGAFGVDDITRIIFEQEVTAKNFCRKLYREFVYDVPDENIVDQLASLLRQNNFELKPVLATLFKSAHFFDSLFVASHVQNPLEYELNLCRTLGISSASSTSIGTMLNNDCSAAGISLFEPPNVTGWNSHLFWIGFNSILFRWAKSDAIIDGTSGFPKIDVLTYAKKYPDYLDPDKFIRSLISYHFPTALSVVQTNTLLNYLLNGAPTYEWEHIITTLPQVAERQIRYVLKRMYRMAEIHLS